MSPERLARIRAGYGDREKDNSFGADAVRDLLTEMDRLAMILREVYESTLLDDSNFEGRVIDALILHNPGTRAAKKVTP